MIWNVLLSLFKKLSHFIWYTHDRFVKDIPTNKIRYRSK